MWRLNVKLLNFTHNDYVKHQKNNCNYFECFQHIVVTEDSSSIGVFPKFSEFSDKNMSLQ